MKKILFLTAIGLLLMSCSNVQQYRKMNTEVFGYFNQSLVDNMGVLKDSVSDADVMFLIEKFGESLPYDSIQYYELEADEPSIAIIPSKDIRHEFLVNHFNVPMDIAISMVNNYDITLVGARCPNYQEAYQLYKKLVKIHSDGQLAYVVEALNFRFVDKYDTISISTKSSLSDVYALALYECISNGMPFDEQDITHVVKGRYLIGSEIQDDVDFQQWKSQIVQQYYKDIYGYGKPIPQDEFEAFNYIVKIYERLEQEKWEKEIDEAFDELTKLLMIY
jgi:hypothetical protein